MAKNESYASLKHRLDNLVNRLQDENIDIDESLKLYKESQQVIAKLETYLKAVKNEIKQIKKV